MSSDHYLRDKDSPIVIVGAGIFGLSTAIHLAQRGFKNVKILDKQPYQKSRYSFENGCDAASADSNKIIRAAYRDEKIYQDLTIEAIKHWDEWNEYLARGIELPAGMTSNDRVYVNTGNLHVTDDANLTDFEKKSVKNLSQAGLGDTQYNLNDPEEVARARRDGRGQSIDAFKRGDGWEYHGLLDTIGGFAYADKACRFALHRAENLGVKLVLGNPQGVFQSFVDDGRRTTGIRTADGLVHSAAVTVVACGGWTPDILPEIDGLCETTAGSLAFIQIPKNSPLFWKYSPDRFPVWQYKTWCGPEGNMYGFPVDEHGCMKLGYRGIKYTHPQSSKKGETRSIPITRWTTPSTHRVPKMSMRMFRHFLDTYMPDLRENGINVSGTRLCWYTDSFDNQFVIDRVPQRPGVVVATGGSGHAFKFLPVIGKFVADIIEGNKDDKMVEAWKWREADPSVTPVNVLMEGASSSRALQNVEMNDEDLNLANLDFPSKHS
ncbi:hypothetical protein AJ79_09882 [Helicocarpus griseus UAMH5409]|uniref:FAD dependent oxidoreductase domain-containing protein n=1 Tax=Helicocarpus griseus UAMH5409 TaxID=1447875 RepID=A0A2B7WGP5_9EURO|nr:hypothetical protein AJ79_09882 [Helicocarpus griseus UAMH5409]